MAVDKAALLTRRCPEDDVELEGVGTVRVRGLTRGEVMRISKGAADGEDTQPLAISLALLDPQLTEDEARQYVENAPFEEIEKLGQAINRLSGIAGRADKEAYKSLRE